MRANNRRSHHSSCAAPDGTLAAATLVVATPVAVTLVAATLGLGELELNRPRMANPSASSLPKAMSTLDAGRPRDSASVDVVTGPKPSSRPRTISIKDSSVTGSGSNSARLLPAPHLLAPPPQIRTPPP